MANYPSLKFAAAVSERANAAWEDGSFLESVTPTTAVLLRFWFDDAHCDFRNLNFHSGQRQAILNAIYIHEVLKKERVLDVYQAVAPHLLTEKGMSIAELADQIYDHPKYAVKMATGTGKTWVLQALMIWQYLNAKHEQGNYTKNFLVVAPGLIVYERLLDAFLGKKDESGIRDFETSDLKGTQDLFIPEEFRNGVFGFLQSAVATKEEIGRKNTGDGVIAITNYHLLMGVDEKPTDDGTWSLDVRPGVAAGNSLDVLDGDSGRGLALEYLASLPDLMVVNDEAHHIHSVKRAGEVSEVEWQKSLRYISENKGRKFIQVDFSATPFNEKSKEKVFFPHIIVDFPIEKAIRQGLVKTITLAERKEINEEELDFNAVRNEAGKVVDLSEGQRRMLSAGLAKLNNLRVSFANIEAENPDIRNKDPKMLVVCEDTNAVPLVVDFLKNEQGMDNEEIIEIHSNKKGEVGDAEWSEIKNQLSALDKHQNPRVVVSVLMLREGFDVNNICVIVPLRSSQSGILLEQTIGRGLRLMWREKEFAEIKAENRRKVMEEHKSPDNSIDVLSIVEHPRFREFYAELLDNGLAAEESDDRDKPTLGDMITVGLKENYEKYDFNFPLIVADKEEVMSSPELEISKMPKFPISLEALKAYIPKNEQWDETEITNGVRFGDFDVTSGVYRATSYNDFIARLVRRTTEKTNGNELLITSGRRGKLNNLPAFSINSALIMGIIDRYIRTQLFGEEFNPQEEDNWRVLKNKEVVEHIIREIAAKILAARDNTTVMRDSEVIQNPLSSVEKLTIRENYALDLKKSIYESTPYPSNKGQFEHDFMLYADSDGEVDALLKIVENRHTFVRLRYVREDSQPAYYYPDFLVRIGEDIYLVETKAQNQLLQENVVRKQRAATAWVEKINDLPAEKRDSSTWHYVILGDSQFYEWKNRRSSTRDILEFFELKNNDYREQTGRLF